jgi:HlyD family secretion protein
LIARLDTEELEARLLKRRAALDAAQARVTEAEATVEETRLRMERCLKLLERQMCTQEDADNSRAAWTRAKAARASVAAQVQVARATLTADETKLGKAVIVAPIDGMVLSRNIEPGQTVASMLQTPILFTLAEDLSQLELHVDVDEADVGRVSVGQSARFTVDAYPERSFEARITQIRFAPKTVQGVVTYETLLALDNPDLALRPGMTATAEIVVGRVDDALLLPNAALRFEPPAAPVGAQRSPVSRLIPGPPGRGNARNTAPAQGAERTVWVLRDGEPVAVAVSLGDTNGRVTQVVAGDIAEGTPVIVGTATGGT